MDKELGFVNAMFSVPIVHYPMRIGLRIKKILDALPEDDSQLEPNGTGLYTDSLSMERLKSYLVISYSSRCDQTISKSCG